MKLPTARGDTGEALFCELRREPHRLRVDTRTGLDGDLELALVVLQELSFRRIDEVDPRWEQEPSLLALRAELERRLLDQLRRSTTVPSCDPADAAEVLQQLIDDSDDLSLSAWVERHATLDHLRELMVHRALYQLKEADPHSFAIPRMAAGRAKAALLEIQLDEYGHGEPSESHAELFRTSMRLVDLTPEPDVDRLPRVTLRTNTLLNAFGASRALVGACIGHLALFEMTSVEPMARYAATCRRLLGDSATDVARFFDVHVAADGWHGRLAREELVGEFVEQHPAETSEVVFGAAALLQAEADLTRHIVGRWTEGLTSLEAPLRGSALERPTATAA